MPDFFFSESHQGPQKVLKLSKFENKESMKVGAEPVSNCWAVKECCLDTSKKEPSYNLKKTIIVH